MVTMDHKVNPITTVLNSVNKLAAINALTKILESNNSPLWAGDLRKSTDSLRHSVRDSGFTGFNLYKSCTAATVNLLASEA